MNDPLRPGEASVVARSVRRASDAEVRDILATTSADWSLSQTVEFGAALEAAFDEFKYDPHVAETNGGGRVLIPAVRVRRRPRWLRVWEAMPLSLPGGLVYVGPPVAHAPVLPLRSLRPDRLVVNDSDGDASAPAGMVVVATASEVVNLEGGFENVWTTRFSRKVRNQCRTAERKGVVVTSPLEASAFGTYYDLYRATARSWTENPTSLHPRRLFEALGRLAGKGVELKLALVAGKPVAGVVLFRGRSTTLYWSGSLLREYASYCPMNALLREAVDDACRRGERSFDFGASGDLDGVHRFKASFGAVPRARRVLEFTSWRWSVVAAVRAIYVRRRHARSSAAAAVEKSPR